MIYELKTYTCLPGRRGQVVKDRERLIPIYERCGMKVIGIWSTLVGRHQQVFLLLQHDNLDAFEKNWAKFEQDPKLLKMESTDMPTEPSIQYEDNRILEPTPLSPLR